MRKRTLIAAAAAAAMATTSVVAFADVNTADKATPVAKSATTGTVTLPTGDTVRVSPGGAVVWQPGKGREATGYVTPTAHDGSEDLIAIPTDVIDDIADGKADPRRYNVSELLRDGQTSAAKAKRLSRKPYEVFAPAAKGSRGAGDNQKVGFKVTARDGTPGRDSIIQYVNPDTGRSGDVKVEENGTGEISLPPGTYDFQAFIPGEDKYVFGLSTVTVKSKPVKFSLDGTKGRKISYKLDRPTKLHEQTIGVYSRLKDGEPIMNMIGFIYEETPAYVIPAEKVDHPTGIEAKPTLYGGDASDPYVYNLNFLQDGGLPKDPTFTARDGDLAQITTKFDGLAFKGDETYNCNIPLHADGTQDAMCDPREVEWQSQRTDLLTPGPKVKWESLTETGDHSNEESVRFNQVFYAEAGKSQRVIGQGPVGIDLDHRGFQKFISVGREGDTVAGVLPFMENTSPDDSIAGLLGTTGTAVLKRDGEEVASSSVDDMGFEFSLPEKDSGRYTLSLKQQHDGAITPLATKSAAVWEFESKPTGEWSAVDVSAVAFGAEGVSNGYAKAGQEQKFTLDYRPQAGAKDTALKKLSFKVSYDDGKTWKNVDIALDGDKASGTLRHPAGAKFVSIKASATDDAGNKVTHSTVRSYGLK